MTDLEDRARQLMRMISIKELNASGDTKERDRWKNLRRQGSELRITTVELERLRVLFPQYEDWLWKGERGVDPAHGQTSPGYDEANDALKQQGGA